MAEENFSKKVRKAKENFKITEEEAEENYTRRVAGIGLAAVLILLTGMAVLYPYALLRERNFEVKRRVQKQGQLEREIGKKQNNQQPQEHQEQIDPEKPAEPYDSTPKIKILPYRTSSIDVFEMPFEDFGFGQRRDMFYNIEEYINDLLKELEKQQRKENIRKGVYQV